MSTEDRIFSNRIRRKTALALKRAFDLGSSFAVAAVTLPAFPLLALGVKMSSPGPVFFVQERVGYRRKHFLMIKFRTMRVTTEDDLSSGWTTQHVERVTKIGDWMRDYGIDELPQLLNIIRGDMSVVGPRPPLVVQVKDYTEQQKKMFDMRPGIVSLAAIRGRRALSLEKRIGYHVEYVENWSLKMDLQVLWRSFFVVLDRKNAVELMSKPQS